MLLAIVPLTEGSLSYRIGRFSGSFVARLETDGQAISLYDSISDTGYNREREVVLTSCRSPLSTNNKSEPLAVDMRCKCAEKE